MAFTLDGTLTVEIDKKEILIKGKDFQLQEERSSEPDEDEKIYQALFVYYDDRKRFEIFIEGRTSDDGIYLTDPEVVRTDGRSDEIKVIDNGIEIA